MRKEFILTSVMILLLNLLAYFFYPPFLWSLAVFGPFLIIGYIDLVQKKQTIRRNFPIFGNLRYLLEIIRPEIQQYFVESNRDGRPFNRELRSIVYQRAKKTMDTLPFGTQMDVYEAGYEWVNHSIAATHYTGKEFRVVIGGPDCKQPYDASILNIGAMSYGALSKTAIESLSKGAKLGNFAHNTGEGGISDFHINGGGDLIWQIGTGYFGCRTHDGRFSDEMFKQRAHLPNVKMIEIKLSQGAKPGHGGILPGAKVTPEIAKIRGVPLGKDVISPPFHTEFSTPIELLLFVKRLRDLSGGKPIGIKFCLGRRREFFSLCKAMIQTNITPDFITVDGGEGGTGAAPLEFSNRIGFPLREALIFVHNCLVGYSLRNKIKVIASGRVITGFDLVSKIALGADLFYSARAMMLALGCIQALRCNANVCPAGIATQNPDLYKGIDIPTKSVRVKNYHEETIHSFGEILAAMGFTDPKQLKPWHVMRRMSFSEVKHYGELFKYVDDGQFLTGEIPSDYIRAHSGARADSFQA